jgi:hypothetical protein
MAIGNLYRPPYGANDWTARLPPGSPSADPGMVVLPYTDPGYGMPNADIGNLNQSPGLAVGGALRANVLQSVDPNSSNPLAQAPSWGAAVVDDYGRPIDVSPLARWLAEQRAKNAGRSQLPSIYRSIAEGEMAPMTQEQAFSRQNWPATPIPNNNAGTPVTGIPIPNNAPGFYAGDPQTQTNYAIQRTPPMQQLLQRFRLARPGVDI